MQNLPSPRMPAGEAADYLGVSGSTLAKWRMSGRGPKFVKAGSRVIYDRVDLDAWLESHKRQHTAQSYL